MIVARIIPVKSRFYKSLSKQAEKLDGFFQWKPYHWFGVWVLMSSGVGAQEGILNRYSYWNMSHAGIGLITLLIVTVILAFLLKNDHISFDNIELKLTHLFRHFVLALVLFLTGWGWINGDYFTALESFLPYVLAYGSVLLMYRLNMDEIPEKGYQPGKGYIAFCLLLALASSAIGVIVGDPVISTASMVYAPFLVVAIIFPEHKRHIQRIRIYPIFIYAMFVSVRVPWLLIPLAILFFSLRTYNYFRYNILYPTFSVEHD